MNTTGSAATFPTQTNYIWADGYTGPAEVHSSQQVTFNKNFAQWAATNSKYEYPAGRMYVCYANPDTPTTRTKDLESFCEYGEVTVVQAPLDGDNPNYRVTSVSDMDKGCILLESAAVIISLSLLQICHPDHHY